MPPVVGSARSSILSLRKQAYSDSLLLADAWYCGPICIQPGPGIPLRELVPPDQRNIGIILCSETPHNCSRVGKGNKEEKIMESRRKICTHGQTDRHSIQPTHDGRAVLHQAGRQAGRRETRQANSPVIQPASQLDFCEVVFALANVCRLCHKSADTPSSHSPTHGI